MKIAIASDHGGYELKSVIKEHLVKAGYEVIDLGTDSAESVDYPVYGKKCAEYVVGGSADKGIVICGTGIGVSIAANKVHGVRCALVTTEFMAEMASEHNGANVLALGGRVLDSIEAIKLVDIWLNTATSHEERHVRRVAMLDEM